MCFMVLVVEVGINMMIHEQDLMGSLFGNDVSRDGLLIKMKEFSFVANLFFNIFLL